MGGKTRRPEANEERRLHLESMSCPACQDTLRIGYTSWRQVATLEGVLRLKVSIGRCENRACARYHRPVHPVAEGQVALPHYEYGLDVLALVGALRRGLPLHAVSGRHRCIRPCRPHRRRHPLPPLASPRRMPPPPVWP